MRFAVMDLECTHLNSDEGFLLCGGIKPLGEPGYVISLDDCRRGPARMIDKFLALKIRDELEKYDGIITWNGIMFDIPFLNDRLLRANQRPLRKMFHIDAMYYARQGMSRLKSSRLDWVAKWFRIPMSKTSLDITTWVDAYQEVIAWWATKGNLPFKRAFKYIVEHCHKDLEVTEMVYNRLKPRIRRIQCR